MKSSTRCFQKRTKILADFQICISVPLRMRENALIEKYSSNRAFPFHGKITSSTSLTALTAVVANLNPSQPENHEFWNVLMNYKLALKSVHPTKM